MVTLMEQPTTGGQHARTAVEHLERDLPVLPPKLSAAAARDRLTGLRYAYAGQVAVCRGTRLGDGGVPVIDASGGFSGSCRRGVWCTSCSRSTRRTWPAWALTGVLVGLVLSAVFLPFALLYGEWRVALTAVLALLSAFMVATLVAMGLPSLLHRLGRDPAFGAGPLATVVQDLLSIVIYLMLARLLVGGPAMRRTWP